MTSREKTRIYADFRAASARAADATQEPRALSEPLLPRVVSRAEFDVSNARTVLQALTRVPDQPLPQPKTGTPSRATRRRGGKALADALVKISDDDLYVYMRGMMPQGARGRTTCVVFPPIMSDMLEIAQRELNVTASTFIRWAVMRALRDLAMPENEDGAPEDAPPEK